MSATPASAGFGPPVPAGGPAANANGERFGATAFFAEHDLESLLDGVDPVEHLGALAIRDLTDDEADAFLAALRD